ncbi:glycosyltransferase family 4 protein [Pseudomonadota bacterium]
MGESIKVLLVVTHPPGLKGSMARFADLVETALSTTPDLAPELSISRMNLAFPWHPALWMPARIQTWLNHLWLMVFARWRMGRSGADLVHLLDGSYGYLLKNFTRIPAIATVHDLIPLLQQDGRFGANRSSVFARKVIRDARLGLRNCVHLLAVSANTAQDLAAFDVADCDNVTVVPSALAPSLTALSVSSQERLGRECLGSNPSREPPYILHVGNNGCYKNRKGVIRIFARVRQELKLRLVMAGPAPTDSIYSLVRDLLLEEFVDFVVTPDDSRLVELYENASVFLFPSLYEGFGWPPLEAMACGCPVVCSSAGSLPEVVGDAALTASAENEEQLADHCLAVLTDAGLASVMIGKGLEWSSQFSVERMRGDLERAYHAALSRAGNVNVAAE